MPAAPKAAAVPQKGHVIVVGYNTVARLLLDKLQQQKIPVICVTNAPEKEIDPRPEGDFAPTMIMGEAKDPMILVKARITSAAYVVLPLKDTILNRQVIKYVRQLRPDIPVLVRVPDDDLPDNWTRDANTHILTNNEAMLMALLGELVRAFSRPETQQRAPEPDPEDVTPPPAGDEADDEAQPGRLGRLLGWTGLASEKLSAAAGSTAHSAGTWVKSLGGRFRRTGN